MFTTSPHETSQPNAEANHKTTTQTNTAQQAEHPQEHTHQTYLATLARSIRGNLIIGSTSNQVKTLQTLLASNKTIYPQGIETGYYGPLTIRAVQRFQRKYGIVSYGTPRTTGYGYVGPRTLAKIHKIYSEQTSIASEQTTRQHTEAKPAQSSATSAITTAQSEAQLRSSAITHTLNIGEHSNQVKALQQLLASNKTIYPQGIETGYYGPLTTRAVERFQRKYGIVSGNTPIIGYGRVGPRTLAKIHEVFGGSTSAYAQSTARTTMTKAERQVRIAQIEQKIRSLLKIVAQLSAQLKLQMKSGG